MRTAAVIPARTEGRTIRGVVEAAKASPLVDEIIVVDGDSTDDTRAQAQAAGARVITQPENGKGEAMAAGVRATSAGVIVFLDADLTGFGVHHVDRLVRSVTAGGAVMACGLFDRGPVWNQIFLHVLPILTGERALRREIFESLQPDDIAGYRVEAALNARAAELGGPIAAFVCHGMFHRTKEEKYSDPLRGSIAKVAMIATAFSSYIRYWVHHRLRRSA